MKSFMTFAYLFLFSTGFLLGQDPEFTLDNRIPDGVCKTVFAVDNILYTGNGAAVDIYDISQPDTLVFLGRLVTVGTVNKIFVNGDYAYLAEGRHGVVIADVSDSGNPEISGAWALTDGGDTAGIAEDVFPSGNYLFVVYGDYGLRALDISNPSAPTEVGHILEDDQNLTYAYAVDVKGNYAYVANHGFGMNIIDVSDPSAMFQAGAYENSGTYPSFNDVYVTGDLAFISADWRGMVAIDVSDPANPFKTDSYGTGDLAVSVFVSGNFAFVTEQPAYTDPDSTVGLTVIDVSDPYNLSGVDTYLTPGLPYQSFAKDTLVFIADREYMELLSFQATVGQQEVQYPVRYSVQKMNRLLNNKAERQALTGREGELDFIKNKDFFGKTSDLVGIRDADENLWLIHGTSSGLFIIDEDNHITGGFPVSGKFIPNKKSLFIRKTDEQVLLYALTDKEIAVFDITDMENISKINSFTHDEYAKLVGSLNDNLLVVSDFGSLLRFYDMSDPVDPNPPTGTVTTTEPASGISFDGDYIYVVEESDLEIFEYVDVDNIIKKSTTPLTTFPDFLSGVDVSFPLLIYSTETGIIGLMDVSDPANPQAVQDQKVSDAANDVRFLPNPDYAAVVRETAGLSIFRKESGYFDEASHFSVGDMALQVFIFQAFLAPYREDDTVTYICLADNEDGGYIYKSSPITGFHEIDDGSGNDLLGQNRPNPFGLQTSIHYQVPDNQWVTIKIFDILGREIRTLVDKQQVKGAYSVEWNGTSEKGNMLNNGIYFYSLELNGKKVQTKKMLKMDR